MRTPLDILESIKKVFTEAQSFLIISHRAPDADAIGANLSLRRHLLKQGKKVVSACVDPIPESSMFIEDAKTYVSDISGMLDSFDAVISVDCAAKKLVAYIDIHPDLFDGHIPYINIDHHPSNDDFGTINLVDADACSASFLVYHLLTDMGAHIDPKMATALMHGLYFDTGSFMHPNTDAAVFEMAADLASKGADFKRSAKELFNTTPVNYMRLWGRAMERLKMNREHVAISLLKGEDFDECDADREALSGIMNYINTIPDAQFSMLLAEDGEGNIKGSTRTQRDDVDLSEFCGQFGGGGHKMAAGFTMKGKVEKEVIYKITPEDGGEGYSF